MSNDAKQRLTVSRRDLLSVIGAVSGSAAMYHAMTALGFAADSGYRGPIKLDGDPKGASVLILAVAVAGDMVLRYRDTRHELAALDAAQGLLNADRRPQRAVSKERLDEEAKINDAVVRQLTLPWAQMIEAVETASSSEVTVLQLQPETQQRSLRLTAEAKTREAMLRYVRRLGETRVLSGVHLVNHHVQVEDPSRPIQFGVQATFRSNR